MPRMPYSPGPPGSCRLPSGDGAAAVGAAGTHTNPPVAKVPGLKWGKEWEVPSSGRAAQRKWPSAVFLLSSPWQRPAYCFLPRSLLPGASQQVTGPHGGPDRHTSLPPPPPASCEPQQHLHRLSAPRRAHQQRHEWAWRGAGWWRVWSGRRGGHVHRGDQQVSAGAQGLQGARRSSTPGPVAAARGGSAPAPPPAPENLPCDLPCCRMRIALGLKPLKAEAEEPKGPSAEEVQRKEEAEAAAKAAELAERIKQ